MPPHKVLAEILEMSGTLFDPKLAKIFIKHIGVFPVGNMVELTSGRLALVAAQNKTYPLKPLVVVFNTRKKIQSRRKLNSSNLDVIITRGNWELVDLADDRGTFGKIRRGLDHRKFHINPSYYLSHI